MDDRVRVLNCSSVDFLAGLVWTGVNLLVFENIVRIWDVSGLEPGTHWTAETSTHVERAYFSS